MWLRQERPSIIWESSMSSGSRQSASGNTAEMQIDHDPVSEARDGPGVVSLDHVNIMTPRFDDTLRFFVDAVGLRRGATPDGDDRNPNAAWLYAGDVAVVHLVRREVPGSDMPEACALDHIAFRCTDMAAMEARLDRHGVGFERRIFPDYGVRQLVIHDPNNIMVELSF